MDESVEKKGYSRSFAAVMLFAVLSLSLLLLLLFSANFRNLVLPFQLFNIPSASNEPTLMIGDNFVVNKMAYGKGHGPQAGDLAALKSPHDPVVVYVKRVVGLPGDKVQMLHGVLQINGAPVKMESVTLPYYLQGTDGPKKFYRETLPNGASYVVGYMEMGPQDNTDAYIVPQGQYFVLGDNRDNSQDSRFMSAIGYVPEKNLIGSVVWVYWNSAGLPLTGRPAETHPHQ